MGCQAQEPATQAIECLGDYLYLFDDTGSQLAQMTMLAGLSTSSESQSTVQIALTCTALAMGILIVDVASLPLGVAAGVACVAMGAIPANVNKFSCSQVRTLGSS